MQLRNTLSRWGVVSQTFHWVIVVLIITQYVLAEIEHEMPLGMARFAVLARHKSIGLTILALAVLRLLWRWMNPSPPLPDTLKPYERVLARVTHFGLYFLLFAHADHGVDLVLGLQLSGELLRLVHAPEPGGGRQGLRRNHARGARDAVRHPGGLRGPARRRRTQAPFLAQGRRAAAHVAIYVTNARGDPCAPRTPA